MTAQTVSSIGLVQHLPVSQSDMVCAVQRDAAHPDYERMSASCTPGREGPDESGVLWTSIWRRGAVVAHWAARSAVASSQHCEAAGLTGRSGAAGLGMRCATVAIQYILGRHAMNSVVCDARCYATCCTLARPGLHEQGFSRISSLSCIPIPLPYPFPTTNPSLFYLDTHNRGLTSPSTPHQPADTAYATISHATTIDPQKVLIPGRLLAVDEF
ncbi:hypothetical protein F5Y12DRAFT_721037 [Xylaria sp. FL1777]|nr:hypothetical protein F5Y12DRAFT_721037 [Xylaria sp. FL1777]